MAKKKQPEVEEELTDEECEEEERVEAREKGRKVYNVSHDHGVVSSDGSIYLHKKKYWASADFDLCELGPFDTLEEAIQKSGLNEFGEGANDVAILLAIFLVQLLPGD